MITPGAAPSPHRLRFPGSGGPVCHPCGARFGGRGRRVYDLGAAGRGRSRFQLLRLCGCGPGQAARVLGQLCHALSGPDGAVCFEPAQAKRIRSVPPGDPASRGIRPDPRVVCHPPTLPGRLARRRNKRARLAALAAAACAAAGLRAGSHGLAPQEEPVRRMGGPSAAW